MELPIIIANEKMTLQREERSNWRIARCRKIAIERLSASVSETEGMNPEIKGHCVGGKSVFRPSDSETGPEPSNSSWMDRGWNVRRQRVQVHHGLVSLVRMVF